MDLGCKDVPFIEQLDVLEKIDLEWRGRYLDNQVVSGTPLESDATGSRVRVDCEMIDGERG